MACLAVSATGLAADALPSTLLDRVNSLAAAETVRLGAAFKGLHLNPELPLMETRTAAIMARGLRVPGFTVKTGIGRTGVVGILRNGDGPVVM